MIQWKDAELFKVSVALQESGMLSDVKAHSSFNFFPFFSVHALWSE